MLTHMDLTNCVQLYQLGSLHNCRYLIDASRNIIMKEFEALMSSGDLVSLGIVELSSLIMDNQLNVSKEEEICQLILKWVDHDADERKPYLEHLFKHIRLPLLSPDYVQFLQENVVIRQDDTCCRMIKNFISSLPIEIGDSMRRHGMFRAPLFVFVSGGLDKSSRSFGCFNPVTKNNYWGAEMHSKFDFKYKIDYHRITAGGRDGGTIYVSGGIFFEDHITYHSSRALSDVGEFSLLCRAWNRVAPMREPRCAHAFISFKTHLYAIGGKTFFPIGPPLDSVERYNIEDDQWESMSQMPIDLYHHRACVHGNNIFVFGGISKSDLCQEYEVREGYAEGEMITNICMSFTPDHDTWCILSSSMRVPRCEMGAALLDGSLYIIGGSDGQSLLNSVEVYNFSTSRWSQGTSFPDNRKCVAAGTLNGNIYMCGGVRHVISRRDPEQQQRMMEVKDLWKLRKDTGNWEQEARHIQFANVHACTTAIINTQSLIESDFVSSMTRFTKK